MKKIVFFFVLVTFSVMTSFAQKNDKVKSEEIKTIKTNFSRINSIKNWTKIKEVETDDSTEGGFINYYFLNDKLEKIVVRKFGESGQYLAEYYLQNNKISFLFEKDMTYNVPFYRKEFDYDKSEIEENRYYFVKNELVNLKSNLDCGAPFANYYLEEEQKRVMKDFNDLLKNSKLAK
ncbi:hypothetical protein [Algoriella sp.]|uniref:hypothetical protein n=1 Tax=Algoriella sp. TaxID=1872434 RepID=UPI002FCA59F2